MLLAIHQPNLCPRLKVLAKIASADAYINLDNVQYVRSDYQNRFQYHPHPTAGSPVWLSIPVHLKAGRGTRISEVEIVEPARTMRYVEDAMRHAYGHSKYRSLILGYFESIRREGLTGSLSRYATASMLEALRLVGIPVRYFKVEDLGDDGNEPNPSARLAKLTLAAGGDEYLSGSGGKNYLQVGEFGRHGVELKWQELCPFAASPNVRNVGFVDVLASHGLSAVQRAIAPETPRTLPTPTPRLHDAEH